MLNESELFTTSLTKLFAKTHFLVVACPLALANPPAHPLGIRYGLDPNEKWKTDKEIAERDAER